MSNIKERLIGAITVMSEDDAEYFWQVIEQRYIQQDWNHIEAVEPDEFDKQLLQEAESDPDCHSFMSAEDAAKVLDALQ